METYSFAKVTKQIYDSGFRLFTVKTLKDLLEIESDSTFFSILKRLLKNEVLLKIERSKYVLKEAEIHDFAIANFIYSPSDISFETALNYHGILSQFPYEVLSGTSKKTTKKTINGKSFVYIHLKKDLIWGYEKKDGFLIALPEKAFLDQVYLAAKGLKTLSLDEYDFSLINSKRFNEYLEDYPKINQFNKIIRSIGKFIKS